MVKLLALKIGMYGIFDALLAILSPQRWREWYRFISSMLPRGAGDYIDEVVEVTIRHQEQSPNSMRGLFLFELALSLAIIKVALKARW